MVATLYISGGYQNSYYLGHLRPIPVIFPNSTSFGTYSNYTAAITDNPPIYLENRPRDNNLRVQISNGPGTTDFHENYLTVASAGGTLQQSGFIVTVIALTAGIITIGTVITPTSLTARTITAFITGTGGTGTYLCDTTASISTTTNFAFPTDTTRGHMAPYILNLSFEEQD